MTNIVEESTFVWEFVDLDFGSVSYFSKTTCFVMFIKFSFVVENLSKFLNNFCSYLRKLNERGEATYLSLTILCVSTLQTKVKDSHAHIENNISSLYLYISYSHSCILVPESDAKIILGKRYTSKGTLLRGIWVFLEV